MNNIIKYDGKTNPSVWLVDYHLACRAGGADDDFFIIQFFPIYLAVDHLPRNSIDCWEDLKEIFTSNFQGTYMRPSNPWGLKGHRQKLGESLRDHIQCFCDADVISAFWSSTNCRTLVHELGRDQPKTKKELLDNATRHASGEEAVGAIFV
jgi:hypothetical protein